jgi:hypothetical protein
MWAYRDAAGQLVSYAVRVDDGVDGKREKDVLPITYCRIGYDNGRERLAWRARGLPAPRQLYRLPELLANPTARVIVCEGETDTYIGGAEGLRGVIDAGHCRASANVLRTVEIRVGSAKDYEVCAYDCWCALAIAAIGRLPGTVEDRSIKIALRRRRPDEPVARLRLDRIAAELEPTARRAARWAGDNVDALRLGDPEIPAELHDLAADNWRPLLAIADAAGSDWPERARRAAVALTAAGADDAETKRTMLLADLREQFDAEPSGVLFTREILDALHGRDDRPWPEYGRTGKPITGRQVAALLKPFEIPANKTVRRGSYTDKGYRREWFDDAFARYLPSPSVTRSQMSESAALDDFVSVTSEKGVTDAMPKNRAFLRVVTV